MQLTKQLAHFFFSTPACGYREMKTLKIITTNTADDTEKDFQQHKSFFDNKSKIIISTRANIVMKTTVTLCCVLLGKFRRPRDFRSINPLFSKYFHWHSIQLETCTSGGCQLSIHLFYYMYACQSHF